MLSLAATTVGVVMMEGIAADMVLTLVVDMVPTSVMDMARAADLILTPAVDANSTMPDGENMASVRAGCGRMTTLNTFGGRERLDASGYANASA